LLLISVMMMQWKRRLSWWDGRDIGADIPAAEALGERGEAGLEHVTVGDRAAFGVGNVEDRVHRALLSVARTVLYRYAWLTRTGAGRMRRSELPLRVLGRGHPGPGCLVSSAPIPDLPALALETGQQEAKVPSHMRRIGLSPMPVNFH